MCAGLLDCYISAGGSARNNNAVRCQEAAIGYNAAYADKLRSSVKSIFTGPLTPDTEASLLFEPPAQLNTATEAAPIPIAVRKSFLSIKQTVRVSMIQ